MISIGICSVDPVLLENVKLNISDTIGIAHEIIVFDNRVQNSGIAKVYNSIIKQCQYPIIALVHEDIIFRTQDWGKALLKNFEADPSIGLIGVAGAELKTQSPSGWWNDGRTTPLRNIIQHYRNGLVKSHIAEGWEKEQSLRQVSVIDGVFIGLRKITNITFNEQLSGFHNYDLSVSINCKILGYKVAITRDLIIEHLSNGTIDKRWILSTHEFTELYEKWLPVSINDKKPSRKLEIANLVTFVQICIDHKQWKLVKYYWWKMFIKYPIHWKQLRIFLYLFKKK